MITVRVCNTGYEKLAFLAGPGRSDRACSSVILKLRVTVSGLGFRGKHPSKPALSLRFQFRVQGLGFPFLHPSIRAPETDTAVYYLTLNPKPQTLNPKP